MMKMNARQLGNTRLAMLNKSRELATRAEFAEDIRRNWLNALEATVQVGRRLNEAKEKLPHGEYEAMVEQDLPFKPATARKLREVAAFVDSGKVPLEQLPEAYSTVYAIATMPEDRRQEALEQGVIRPDVTRRELEALKTLTPTTMPMNSELQAPPIVPAESARGVGTSFDAFRVSAEFASETFEHKNVIGNLLNVEVESAPTSNRRMWDAAEEKSPSLTVTELITLPWYADQQCPGTIFATGGRVMVLVINPLHDTRLDETAVAALAEHIVQLHNAALSVVCNPSPRNRAS